VIYNSLQFQLSHHFPEIPVFLFW